jgi:hypothetical protein
MDRVIENEAGWSLTAKRQKDLSTSCLFSTPLSKN